MKASSFHQRWSIWSATHSRKLLSTSYPMSLCQNPEMESFSAHYWGHWGGIRFKGCFLPFFSKHLQPFPGPLGVISERGTPALLLWLKINRLWRLPDGSRLGDKHGAWLVFDQDPILSFSRSRKKSSFLPLWLEYGTSESFLTLFITPHMP